MTKGENNMYAVEKNVPKPNKKAYKPRSPQAVKLMSMSVGDSIFVDDYEEISLFRQAMQVIKIRGNTERFETMAVDGGYRLWRTA